MRRILKNSYYRTTMLLAVLVAMFFTLQNCGKGGIFSGSSSSSSNDVEVVAIPFKLEYSATGPALNDDSSLSLVSTATNVYAGFTSCASGNTQRSTLIASTINLYKGDRNCLVKLYTFTLGSTTYSTGGSNVVNFTTWLPGNIATFQSTTSATDLIKVFVNTQVTQSGVLTNDTVSYNFTDVTATSTQSLGTTVVKTGVPLSATGLPAPNLTVFSATITGQNANGSDNFAFTLRCGTALTGSSAPTYACSGDVLSTQITYTLVPDNYSQGAISVQQATAAFNSGSTVGSLTVQPNVLDLNTVTLTNGVAMILNPNSVLIVRRTDTSGKVLSYLYFYVNVTLAPVSVAACTTGYFSAGDGTVGNPYQITDSNTLMNVGLCSSTSTYFKVMNNIDLGGTASPWTSIALAGQLDGNSKTITGLYQSGTNPNGLFSTIGASASVTNLSVNSVDITATGNTALGALAGTSSGTVSGCSSSGTIAITYAAATGGLIGNMTGGSLTNSSSTVNLSINDPTNAVAGYGAFGGGVMGGLVGLAKGTVSAVSISSVFATGSITVAVGSAINDGVQLAAGGVVGSLETSTFTATLSNSYGINTISSSNAFMGRLSIGMVGTAYNSTITGCFGGGSFTTTNVITNGGIAGVQIGGLLGFAGSNTVTISNSYSMASISSTGNNANGFTQIGGFFGRAGVSVTTGGVVITNSYSAAPSVVGTVGINVFGFEGTNGTQVTTTNTFYYANGSVPTQTKTGLTGLTTVAQMQDPANYSMILSNVNYVFDFGTPVWRMPRTNPIAAGGVLSPVLAWQIGTNGIVNSSSPTIANGSFDNGDKTSPCQDSAGFCSLAAGSTRITSWTIGGTDLDWIGTFWVHSNGVRSLDMNGSAPGSVSQSVSTTIGVRYVVLFDMAGNASTSPTVKTMTVSGAGTTSTYSFDTTGKSTAAMGWLTRAFTFVATATSTTLTFTSTTAASASGPALDNTR